MLMIPKSLALTSDIKTWLSNCLLDTFIWMPWKHLRNILKIPILYLLLYFLLAFHPLVSHTRNPEINWISSSSSLTSSHQILPISLQKWPSNLSLHFQNKPCPFYFATFYLTLASVPGKLLCLNITPLSAPPPSVAANSWRLPHLVWTEGLVLSSCLCT